jgi:pimeloyl-ACP methyl ester carboxylesterase
MLRSSGVYFHGWRGLANRNRIRHRSRRPFDVEVAVPHMVNTMTVMRASFAALPGAVAAREALAFARQAVLLPRDRAIICPVHVGDGEDVIILLHGLFASAGVLRPLRTQIEQDLGAHTASFSYLPGPSIRTLSLRLAELIDRLPCGARLHLVGHSVGGVVARYYVQVHEPARAVIQTVSIASPFHGTPQARWLPGPIRAEIAPGSELLREIEVTARTCSVPHTSIVAAGDTMVPPSSAVFHYGPTIVMDGRGHNTLLFDDEVRNRVVDLVRAKSKSLPKPLRDYGG